MVKGSENSTLGVYAQDYAYEFENGKSLYDWMNLWRREDDEKPIRSVLGRLRCYSWLIRIS
jgi:ATPase subunit of ABC transporter with duplicated ATPase domains